MSRANMESARTLVEFLSRNQGKPVVLDREDCAILSRCLTAVECLQEAYAEAEDELARLTAVPEPAAA